MEQIHGHSMDEVEVLMVEARRHDDMRATSDERDDAVAMLEEALAIDTTKRMSDTLDDSEVTEGEVALAINWKDDVHAEAVRRMLQMDDVEQLLEASGSRHEVEISVGEESEEIRKRCDGWATTWQVRQVRVRT